MGPSRGSKSIHPDIENIQNEETEDLDGQENLKGKQLLTTPSGFWFECAK